MFIKSNQILIHKLYERVCLRSQLFYLYFLGCFWMFYSCMYILIGMYMYVCVCVVCNVHVCSLYHIVYIYRYTAIAHAILCSSLCHWKNQQTYWSIIIHFAIVDPLLTSLHFDNNNNHVMTCNWALKIEYKHSEQSGCVCVCVCAPSW